MLNTNINLKKELRGRLPIVSCNNQTKICGERRKLIKKVLNLRALDEIITNSKLECKINSPIKSEYNENFCHSYFSSSDKNDKVQLKTLQKYPLYGSTVCTIYQQKIMDGGLKSSNYILNMMEPFRKNIIITISPENDLKELQ